MSMIYLSHVLETVSHLRRWVGAVNDGEEERSLQKLAARVVELVLEGEAEIPENCPRGGFLSVGDERRAGSSIRHEANRIARNGVEDRRRGRQLVVVGWWRRSIGSEERRRRRKGKKEKKGMKKKERRKEMKMRKG